MARESVKKRAVAPANNRDMNAIVDATPDVASALARWYADTAAIRRLWAIEDAAALVVLITLEPTSDGDDSLPVWFAKQRDWTNELSALTRRVVQLQPIVSGVVGDSYAAADAVAIAELSWRDAWISA